MSILFEKIQKFFESVLPLDSEEEAQPSLRG
jgi:hypothetical protein